MCSASRLAISAATLLAAASLGTSHAADDGQWTMPGKDLASTRYSELAEITAANAKGLHPVWSFSTGVLAGHQGQPLVVGNTMYVVTPFPNVLYAFDLTKEGYPLRWKYRPAVSSNAIGVACCDLINRGAFYADGKIVYNLLDGHTVAVNAQTGSEEWVTQIADMGEGETTPMPSAARSGGGSFDSSTPGPPIGEPDKATKSCVPSCDSLTPRGRLPTAIRSMTAPAAGSMTAMSPPVSFDTYTRPP
jgi:glucose dehydrogenase